MFNLNHSDGEEARIMNQMANDDSYNVDQIKRSSSCLLFLTSVTSSILTMKPDTFRKPIIGEHLQMALPIGSVS